MHGRQEIRRHGSAQEPARNCPGREEHCALERLTVVELSKAGEDSGEDEGDHLPPRRAHGAECTGSPTGDEAPRTTYMPRSTRGSSRSRSQSPTRLIASTTS